MSVPIFQVDAFTDVPFSGNPAGVCLLSQPRTVEWMQSVAQEMNVSETAFVQEHDEGFNLRWFTPTVDVDLCGHATLASAHVLWEEGRLDASQPATFHTRSGRLTAKRKDDRIVLDFPAVPAVETSTPPAIIDALGVVPTYVGRNEMDYLIEVAPEKDLRNLNPDFRVLAGVSARGIIVTAAATSDRFDFVSRFFAPSSGIDEDPVTGSAHCCLGPYWQKRLGRNEFTAYQASARGGVVYVRVTGDRVELSGHAVTVLRGQLEV